MGEFCLPLAPKYIGPNSQGRLTLSYALSVDLSNTLTRRSFGADNFQKEHESNTRESEISLSIYLFKIQSIYLIHFIHSIHSIHYIHTQDWTNPGVYIGAQTRI